MPRRSWLALATLLCSVGCKRDRPAVERRAAERTQVAAAQDTVFAGTTEAVHRPRGAGGRPVILRAALATAEPRYDRVVFVFSSDTLPGYDVEYASATQPVRRCGSGDPLSVAGAARLVVRFEPAQAHDQRGTATLGMREVAPQLPVVREMKVVCDFEGQVEWVLGVTAMRPYRVTESESRLIIDVGHGP